MTKPGRDYLCNRKLDLGARLVDYYRLDTDPIENINLPFHQFVDAPGTRAGQIGQLHRGKVGVWQKPRF